MGTLRFASRILVSWVLSPLACGGQASPEGQSSIRGGAGGAVASHPGTGGLAQSGSGGAVVTSVAGSTGTACLVDVPMGAPNGSKDCNVATRRVDSALTCASADCAIKMALDLRCPFLPGDPWLSATADGAVVMVKTNDTAKYDSLARLMTVWGDSRRVDDVPNLADPRNVNHYYSALNSAATVSSSGANWLFAGEAPGITALHQNYGGWTRATAVLAPDPDHGLVLNDVSMIDDKCGYLTYSTWFNQEQHLVAWDGECWTDQVISGTSASSMVIETDAEKRPWVAWVIASGSEEGSLYLRSPSGDTQNILPNVQGDAPVDYAPLRLLPGGLDGTAPIPAVAARFEDGIRILSKNLATDPVWHSLVLPESGAGTGTSDCPSPNYSYGNVDPCVGMTSCHQQWNGASIGFDLTRTQSGAVFAAWVMYSSEGTYALKAEYTGGEMPQDYCGRSETSGSGTAELLIARLTASEPKLRRFRFDLGGAATNLSRKVEMVARGDTLVVAAFLNGDLIPTLSYLEIDSRMLP